MERGKIMNKIFKRTFGVVLAAVMTVSSMLCINAFAANTLRDEIPEGLPAGAYKVYEGIYAVDNYSEIMPLGDYTNVNIGDVPARGSIVEANGLNMIYIDSGDKWLCIRSSAYMYINFVAGNTSIFGANYLQWPTIGSSSSTTYYIDVEYYNFEVDTAYTMLCTSGNGTSHSNVIVSLLTSQTKKQPELDI